jgi:hypothetical protein
MRDMKAGVADIPPEVHHISVEHNYALRSSHHDTAHTRDLKIMKRKAVLVRLNSLLHPTAEITLLQESNFPPCSPPWWSWWAYCSSRQRTRWPCVSQHPWWWLQLILNNEKIPFCSNFNNLVQWNTNEDRFASPVLDLTFNFEPSSSLQDLKTENESQIWAHARPHWL